MIIEPVHFGVKMGEIRGKKDKMGVQRGKKGVKSYLSYHFDHFLIFVSLDIFSCAKIFLISEFLLKAKENLPAKS